MKNRPSTILTYVPSHSGRQSTKWPDDRDEALEFDELELDDELSDEDEDDDELSDELDVDGIELPDGLEDDEELQNSVPQQCWNRHS